MIGPAPPSEGEDTCSPSVRPSYGDHLPAWPRPATLAGGCAPAQAAVLARSAARAAWPCLAALHGALSELRAVSPAGVYAVGVRQANV